MSTEAGRGLLPLRSSDFTPVAILASGFGVEEVAPGVALRTILSAWGTTYDGQPISIPAPADVPLEIPTVIVPSHDGTQSIEVARSRVNLRATASPGADIPAALIEFGRRLARVFRDQAVSVGRLAAIISRQAQRDSPGIVLARQFCRAEMLSQPLNRPDGFELHAHKVFSLVPGLSVNSWMRVKTAKRETSGPYELVIAEQDLNTLSEELRAHSFTEDEITEFYGAAAREFDVILDMYFRTGR